MGDRPGDVTEAPHGVLWAIFHMLHPQEHSWGNMTQARHVSEALTKDKASVSPTMRLSEQEETGRIIEMQRLEIRRLRDQIQEQEQIPGFHTMAGVRLPSLADSDVDFEVYSK